MSFISQRRQLVLRNHTIKQFLARTLQNLVNANLETDVHLLMGRLTIMNLQLTSNLWLLQPNNNFTLHPMATLSIHITSSLTTHPISPHMLINPNPLQLEFLQAFILKNKFGPKILPGNNLSHFMIRQLYSISKQPIFHHKPSRTLNISIANIND